MSDVNADQNKDNKEQRPTDTPEPGADADANPAHGYMGETVQKCHKYLKDPAPYPWPLPKRTKCPPEES